MMEQKRAQVFPPGEFIREEIEERGWTQTDLASILARPLKVVNEIINGKRGITPDTAQELGCAFGTSAQLWMNLETAYRLGTSNGVGSEISRRALLFDKAPVGEMIRRKWIKDSDDPAELEKSLVEFFGLSSISDELATPAAARTGMASTIEFSASQLAWMHRAKHLAQAVSAAEFTLSKFKNRIEGLRHLLAHEEQVREAPRALADMGVRLVLIKHLKGTRIDGACIWLDKKRPVVAISLRFDRNDWFWFTLFHELAHVFHQDCVSLDEELGEDREKPDYEMRADKFAANLLIPTAEFNDFVLRAGPLFYRDRITGFARRIGVHPGLVVGRLHHYSRDYSLNRNMLANIRKHIVGAGLTDGWGSQPTIAPR